jgi:predicted O-methyltransferase YrrM
MPFLGKFGYALMHPKASYDYFFRIWKISRLTGVPAKKVKYYFNELKSTGLYENVQNLIASYEHLGTMLTPLRAPTIYVICRCVKPDIVVETGVASGVSSTFILKALEQNKKGILYSIDYPFDPHGTILPKGRQVGWLIPNELRYRWRLIIGKSSEKLKPLLDGLKEIDVFLHDSEHTYENMMYEFETAWLHLKEGGILLSDDITWNEAFSDFCRKFKPRYMTTFNVLGALRK